MALFPLVKNWTQMYLDANNQVILKVEWDSGTNTVVYVKPDQTEAPAGNYVVADNATGLLLNDDSSVKRYRNLEANGDYTQLTFAKPTPGFGTTYDFGPEGAFRHGLLETSETFLGNIHKTQAFSNGILTSYRLQELPTPGNTGALLDLKGIYANGTSTVSLLSSATNGTPISVTKAGFINGLTTLNAATLIGNDGSTLIGNDGSTFNSTNGATLIGNDGSTLVGRSIQALIGNDGSTILARDGAGLVAAGSLNLVAAGGGNLVAAGGGNIAAGVGAQLAINAMSSFRGYKLASADSFNEQATPPPDPPANAGDDFFDVRGTVANAADTKSFEFPIFARTATAFDGGGGNDTLGVDLATSYGATYEGGEGTDLLIMDWSRSSVGIQRVGDSFRSYSHTEKVNNQDVDRFFTVNFTNVERFDITTGKVTLLFGSGGIWPFSNSYSNANDSVAGGALDDRFKVWGGHDTVHGGAGSDTLVIDWSLWDHYNSQAVGTTISGTLATGYSGRIHTDRPWFNNSVIEFPDSVDFTGIERFDVTLRNFGDNNDSLTMGDGDDTARGMAGNDTIDSAGGIDSIDGGEGDADRWIANKSFMTAGQAMVVDLNAEVQATYLGAGTLRNVETIGLITGDGDDRITTRRSQQSDTVSTGKGNDIIKVIGGIDTVDGGEGDDLLIVDWSPWNPYTSSAIFGSVAGSLATGYSGVFDGGYSGDKVTISGIERFDLTLRNAGPSDDNVTTGDGNDTVRGMAGNDTINSAGGIDSIDGGEGDADRWIADKSFMSAGQAMVVDLNAEVQATYLGAGTLKNVETIGLITGDGDDRITTRRSQQSDTVSTGGGDDVIKIYGGIDTVDGGGGNDLLVLDWSPWNPYTSSAIFGSVNGSLATGYTGVFDGGYSGDKLTFSGIERFDLTLRNAGPNDDNVTTGDGDDIVRGMAGNDAINTAGGNDTLIGGAGNDALNGGDGTDLADWSEATGNLTFLLAADGAGTFDNPGTGRDTFTGIEGVRLGNGNDKIVGNARANVLDGNGGNDVLIGDGVLMLTTEAQSIRRLYIATLDRGPDAAGWTDWTTQLEGGLSLDQIAAGFVNSKEFQDKYGPLGNAQFVTQLYRNVLDREPDAGGLAAYTGALNANALTRTQVVTTFSESAEFKAGTSTALHAGQIYRLYGATLARAPDSGGFETWTDGLGNGRGLVDIALGFVNSDEFQAKYGALNNENFVSLLYTNVLGRAADGDGLAYWTGQLGGAQTRTQVVTGFSESQEYINGTRAGTDAYMRSAMAVWNDTLIGGAGDDKMTGGRGADRFVFTASDGGADTIYGFESFDTLELKGFGFANSGAALAAITQQGGNAVLTYTGGSITFADTPFSVLQAVGAQGWVLG